MRQLDAGGLDTPLRGYSTDGGGPLRDHSTGGEGRPPHAARRPDGPASGGPLPRSPDRRRPARMPEY